MYAYTWDTETGGILLNSSPLSFSKEPRPVYYKELDILGFDKYWKYDKDDKYPYMWAEANTYWYRGVKVAKTKGGTLYQKPDIEILENPEKGNKKLKFVDIPKMIKKNKQIMENLVQETIKDIYNTYVDYKDKIDVFYVAFSGGKDSAVTLDLVQRALPHNAFKVLFGNTCMEFPDTYKTIEVVEKECKEKGIEFITATSEYSPEYTWKKFGPPATVTRWCCGVHKTAPQILALRKYTQKSNFTGMAFIGVRASESLSRSDYDYISLGEKHKGQYSCNPILEWNSAELYIYIYMNNLYLNEAYKKGNRRAGCLVCPRAAERNDFMARECYPKEFDKFLNLIKDSYKNSISDKEKLDDFIAKGGWKARKNGRDLSLDINYNEKIFKGNVIITVKKPSTDWKTWIKTIGILLDEQSPYNIMFGDKKYTFEVREIKDGYEVSINEDLLKIDPKFMKFFKNVFRKAACCIGCHECEADCPNGCIKMVDGKVEISEDCIHCCKCHTVEKGCLVYKSLEMPKGGLKMKIKGSLNCYSHHAPKSEWFNQYFSYKNEFDEKHSLGSQMYSFFKRFLRDAELLDKEGFSKTAEVIDELGLDNLSSWGIMLANLAYTPQINWYVKTIKMNDRYDKDYVLSLLISDGAKESWVSDVWSSIGRLLDLPFSEVGMGVPTKEKRRFVSFIRTPWINPDPRVILYSLYKFAEKCGDYYSFTLSRLLNHELDSDGVSPTEIFGIDKSEMEKILTGLSINYPDFINASFTHDLDNITLRSDKTSEDVLKLFNN